MWIEFFIAAAAPPAANRLWAKTARNFQIEWTMLINIPHHGSIFRRRGLPPQCAAAFIKPAHA